MLKIVDNRSKMDRVINVKGIPLGFFFGRIDNIQGLFLRTYDEIAYVENPECTWEITNKSEDFKIDKYQPLQDNKTTITIEDE